LGRTCGTHGGYEKHKYKILIGNLKERDHLGDHNNTETDLTELRCAGAEVDWVNWFNIGSIDETLCMNFWVP